jgi:DNA-binding HxlR family transcriptional regulator
MQSTLDQDLLTELTRNRWLLPVLAQFHGVAGRRFAELLGVLELPRDSLARTLELALARGWLQRNPGHGHPLRPEYILTEPGIAVAGAAASLASRLSAAHIRPGELTRWSLPALGSIAAGRGRFNELARSLAPASPRALSQTLRALVANDLVERTVEAGFPPSSRYCLTDKGRELTS